MDIDDRMILVAGGPGARMGTRRSVGGLENAPATKKIELPKNWDKRVAKCKNVVPNYEKYRVRANSQAEARRVRDSFACPASPREN
jgi:hypothetical protein